LNDKSMTLSLAEGEQIRQVLHIMSFLVHTRLY
jgi:hypothetical protein